MHAHPPLSRNSRSPAGGRIGKAEGETMKPKRSGPAMTPEQERLAMLAAIQRKVEEATLKSKRRGSARTPAEELDSMSGALMRTGREPERLTPAARAREIRIAKVADQLRAWAKANAAQLTARASGAMLRASRLTRAGGAGTRRSPRCWRSRPSRNRRAKSGADHWTVVRRAPRRRCRLQNGPLRDRHGAGPGWRFGRRLPAGRQSGSRLRPEVI